MRRQGQETTFSNQGQGGVEGGVDASSRSYFHDPKPPHHQQQQDMAPFHALQQNFLDDIVKLVNRHNDAEDAENARHRERINAINAQYEDQLAALRARHASRRDEFLRKESQARQQQYLQAMMEMDHYPNSSTGAGHAEPYNCPAAVGEGYRAYSSDRYDSYRERAHFLGGPRDHGFEPRGGPFPRGRVYDTGSRYY